MSSLSSFTLQSKLKVSSDICDYLKIKYWLQAQLRDGNEIPILGFGTKISQISRWSYYEARAFI